MTGGSEALWSEDAESDDDDLRRRTVAVVLTHEQNRRLLSDWLTPVYDVLTPSLDEESPDVADADLLLLDAGAYERYRDWVGSFRDRQDAVFSPVLLLAPNDAGDLPDVWSDVDDVVSMPAQKAVLQARIDGLLARRELTQEVVAREHDLERQVDRLDEFAGVLAHEMRNPLSIASGWLQQAEATGDPEAFRRIEAAHSRMHCITDRLLALAREGNVIGETTTAPLGPLLTESWKSVETHGATLDIDPELTGWTVRADRHRIQEVFTNLFRNSVEHGSTGNQTAKQSDDAVEHGSTSPRSQAHEDDAEPDASDVTVTVGLCEDGTGIYVEDDGPGLGEADQDKLFAPGYTTAAAGTGFGLAIVEQIVEAHGWSIRATEGRNGGARFEILGLFSD